MARLHNIFMTSMIGVILVLCLMGMTLMIRASSLWSQEAAGWAQAIGSIAAIGTGFVVANRQARHAIDLARRERVEADTDRLTAALELARYAHQIIEEAVPQMTTPHEIYGFLAASSHYIDFKGAAKALEAIPLNELRSVEMIKGVIALQNCVARLHGLTEFGQRDPAFAESDIDDWITETAEVRDFYPSHFDLIVGVVDRARRQLWEWK